MESYSANFALIYKMMSLSSTSAANQFLEVAENSWKVSFSSFLLTIIDKHAILSSESGVASTDKLWCNINMKHLLSLKCTFIWWWMTMIRRIKTCCYYLTKNWVVSDFFIVCTSSDLWMVLSRLGVRKKNRPNSL